ncbi:hypothetical protein M422DRAFT_35915 [Sphaerobolus stellatus SS14]|uniref:SWIM-type domain-containing protein n=1 Tax=Sphaerobolus stellatus (strain SS14) TaxID=990650 RepID=A0A0C9TQ68_SPHS4|nr:hypothetical protein M422DRAFT_35915 [Sphaerobolus stellatus SS14]
MTKLVPTYYHKLDALQNYNRRNRLKSSWHKHFKSEWKRCEKAMIGDPENLQYTPNPQAWVCTCPYFTKSRFFICKHLIQLVHTVPPSFFLEAN